MYNYLSILKITGGGLLMVKIKSNFSKLVPYKLPRRTLDSEMLNLDFNEGFFLNLNFVSDIQNALAKCVYIKYMDYDLIETNRLLASFHSIDPLNLLVCNGSDAAIELIIKTYLRNNSKVAFPALEYSNFQTFLDINRINKNAIHRVPNKNLIYNLKKLLISNPINLVYLSNPNNPTGSLIPYGELERLIINHPGTIFIVDEAYIHFSTLDKSSQDSFINLAVNQSNLVVLRTLSKAFSLAGIRSGYLISNKIIVAELSKINNFKNITFFNVIGIKRHVLDYDSYMNYVSLIIENRENLEKIFLLYNSLFDLYNKSYASFILFKVKKNHDSFLSILNKHKISIRPIKVNLINSENFYRITIPLELTRVLKAFEEFIILNK
jgi:histidinol-phosphate aminotransferase